MTRSIVLGVILASGTVARAERKGMPLDAHRPLIDGEKHDPVAEPAGILGLDYAARVTAMSHSRLEAESKIEVYSPQEFETMVKLLHRMSTNGQAEDLFGRGWNLEYLKDYEYQDVYLDNGVRDLARLMSGTRDRTVNGKDRELNVKPPGALRSGPQGMIWIRPELGLPLGPKADLKKVAAVRSDTNPVLALEAATGKKGPEFMDPSMKLRAKRGRFVLGVDNGVQGWKSLIELSADDVFEMIDLRGQGKGGGDHILGMEGDLNHPGSGTEFVIAGVRWAPPHSAADAHRPELLADPAVRELHRVMPLLANWLAKEGNLVWHPALPKYTEAAIRRGLIRREDLGKVAPAGRQGVNPGVRDRWKAMRGR